MCAGVASSTATARDLECRCGRPNQTDVVDAFADVREQLADFEAALAVVLELERRSHQVAGLALGFRIAARERHAVIIFERRLAVERIDVREAAIERVEIRFFARGAKCGARTACVLPASARAIGQGLTDRACQTDHAEAAADAAQSFTSRGRCWCVLVLHDQSPLPAAA